MSPSPDALVIGAGIVGAACAEALSREGMKVCVLEKNVVGGGATGAGMGHVVVMDDSEAQFALTRYSGQLWDRLRVELPTEVEFERTGTIWVAADGEEMAVVRQKEAFYSSRGVAVEVLDAKSLAEAEPNLRPGLAGGLLARGDSVIYAPCAARWLIERAVARGGRVRMGVQVSGFEADGVRLGDGTRLSAGLTICATGTWATELFPALAVRPRKGHLVITDRYPGFVRHQLVELGYLKSAHGDSNESVAFNVQPRRSGQLLIGSSRQYDQTDASVDRPLTNRMLRRAVEYMPALAALSAIRCWTGFRASTADNLPVIGRCPSRGSIFLATGHEGLGITTSLGTGQLVAELVMGRTPMIDAAPYSPARLNAEPVHAQT